MTTSETDALQLAVAARVILELLQRQTASPFAITLDELPGVVLDAAAERQRHGDFGAAIMLEIWADLLTKPVDEWNR